MKTNMIRAGFMVLALLPPIASADDLKPRAEVNVRAGTERSILMTEFWAPLAQQSDRVLYGDLRLMGDDGDNREGNLGFGYRQISTKTNSVLGSNIWIDRRRTENGNNFHQLTLGLESLGDKIDLRANGYIQLNNSKTTITPNIGSTTPYLAGSGIFFDTNGFIVEEPQDGFDVEIGYRLPVLQKYIDATRVYVGGYHFSGDLSDNTSGFRVRAEAQVNSIFSVGARFQHDDPRGSQGFLEATLRFPFKSKKLYQEHGLRSRLDESPERDIDIVTGAKVDSGLMKPVVNTAGTEQRILYVDNTNINSGDGTKENPFNTLIAAQTVLQENDILYVNRGDGTTTGMDQGFVINKSNVQLIGSGSALNYAGFTLLEAGLAPVITNTITPSSATDLLNGNGILVLADKAYLTGVTVSGAQSSGIRIFASGNILERAYTHNITTENNFGSGIYAIANNGGQIGTLSITDSTTSSNKVGVTGAGMGISVNVEGEGSRIENYIVTGNTAINSIGSYGLYSRAFTGGVISNINVTDNVVSNNSLQGIRVDSNGVGSVISSTIIDANTASGNGQHGIIVTTSNGTIGQAIVSNNILAQNAQNGLYLQTTGAAIIGSVAVTGNYADSNVQNGLEAYANGGEISSLLFANNVSESNGLIGLAFRGNSSGAIAMAQVTGNNIINNGRHGLSIATISISKITASISDNNIVGNSQVDPATYGIYLDYDSTVAGSFNIDLGGGILGSFGNNRVFGNLYRDVFVDSRRGTAASENGGTISAQYNWWGVNTGLDQATRATFDNGTATIGSSLSSGNYLTIDPRP